MGFDDPRNDVVLKTIAFAAVDDLLVLCHTADPPSDEEWNTWVEACEKNEHQGILISSAGGAPNSRQRARAAGGKKVTGPRPPVALLTDSAALRSVMTAFSWLLGQSQRMKAFSPDDLEGAVDWLGQGARAARVRTVLARLRAVLSQGSAQRSAR